MLPYELSKQFSAFPATEVRHSYPVRPEESLRAPVVQVLSNDHSLYPEVDDGPRAHVARHQGGIEDGPSVILDPPCVSEAVDLGVEDWAVELYFPVPPPADYPALSDKDSPNGDAPFTQAFSSLLQGLLHKPVQPDSHKNHSDRIVGYSYDVINLNIKGFQEAI